MASITIKGYRSAISQVFRYRGLDLTQCPELNALFKNFDLEIPKKSLSIPKWDLSLVLMSLMKSPYEPLHKASLKDVTMKTAFLIALASAKRISELQGLSGVVSHSHQWKKVTLTFVPEFVAKTQVPGRSSTRLAPVDIPALSQVLGDEDEDRVLCPVRSLRRYLKLTEDFRQDNHRLFLSCHSKKRRSVSKNTISHWLSFVIRQAYAEVSAADQALTKIRPHEIRALSTSLLFKKTLSLQDVMAAASWRSNSTFSSFYLRDLAHQSLDLHSLGPIVAAQQVV